jgi:hypothetical protein
MGVLDTKMEKYLPWRNGTLNVCLWRCKGWNTLPYLEQANFIWMAIWRYHYTCKSYVVSSGELVNPMKYTQNNWIGGH